MGAIDDSQSLDNVKVRYVRDALDAEPVTTDVEQEPAPREPWRVAERPVPELPAVRPLQQRLDGAPGADVGRRAHHDVAAVDDQLVGLVDTELQRARRDLPDLERDEPCRGQ